MLDGKLFKNAYLKWLKEEMTYNSILDGEYLEVNTPFLDRNNDYTQIYIKQIDSDRFMATDAGCTLNELELSGVNINTPTRKQLLGSILRGFGVQQEGQALTVNFTMSNFPQMKNNLLQAMLAVDDMFYLSKPNTKSLFIDEVEAYFYDNGIACIRDTFFTGRSGLNHKVDFTLPKMREQPERYVNLINNIDRTKTASLIFQWEEIASQRRTSRNENATMIALINNTKKSVSSEYKTALTEYNILPVLWTERANCRYFN